MNDCVLTYPRRCTFTYFLYCEVFDSFSAGSDICDCTTFARDVSQLGYLNACTHTHTHLFNGPLSGTTRVSRYQKGKTNLDFTEARDSEWQWHQLGHMQVCIALQTDSHASTPPLGFLQVGCPSCHPTNSVKAVVK